MEINETVVTLHSENNGTPVRRHHHRHNVKSRYEFVKTLGKGTYGKVKLARHKETNQLVAVKAIRKDRVKDSVDMRHIRREMEIMSSIKHPHIIQIYEVFENQDKIVIVMEYAAGGELYDYLTARKGVPDTQAKKFFGQIVSAVRHCHKRGVVHRDLKLENILLDDHNQIKIADFGLANYFKTDSLLSTYCGSPLYASPEIVCGIPYKGPEVDSWSLGVLLYTLVYGTMPFDGRSFPVLTKQITTGDFCKPAKLSDAHCLISAMLTVDPKHRATVDDIASHRWVSLTADLATSESPDSSDYSDYLNGTLEAGDSAGDLESTLKASSNDDATQPKSILKNTETRKSDTSEQDENLAGQLAAVCGLHAKDSLKLKTKPQRASAKRRVLRTKRDRESGYYSSPERVPIIRETAAPSDPVLSSVPQIKSSLVAGNRLARLNLKPSAPSKVPNQSSKDCYLVPINPGPDERLASLSSDDGCSIGSSTRPASTYSDSSILSSDSFDLCLFDCPIQNNQERLCVAPKPCHHPLPVSSSDDVTLTERAQGSLTPKSEKLVHDIQRILAPGGRRTKRDSNREPPARPHSLESPQLSSMVNQLSVDLDLAYKKAIDVYSNIRSAEV